MPNKLLDGLVVLLLEDEFLIAMDVEHLCLEEGAANVVVVGNPDKARLEELPRFDVAIVDLMLAGRSTLSFAGELLTRGIPFVFASGYPDRSGFDSRFANVPAVAKPYAGSDLIEAVAGAYRHSREKGEAS